MRFSSQIVKFVILIIIIIAVDAVVLDLRAAGTDDLGSRGIDDKLVNYAESVMIGNLASLYLKLKIIN